MAARTNKRPPVSEPDVAVERLDTLLQKLDQAMLRISGLEDTLAKHTAPDAPPEQN